MNSKERIWELKQEIYNTVVNNNWRLTIETFDNKIYRGGLIKQRELDNYMDVVVTILTDFGKEVDIHLKNIKEVRK